MPKFAVVSRQRHGTLRWLRPHGLGFAAKDATVPVFGVEVANVVPAMPIALVKQGDNFQLSAVLSMASDLNMFVDPNGNWLGSYVPAMFRAHPFQMLKPSEAAEPVLCIDEERGLASEGASTGEAFFTADGGLSPALQAVIDFLAELERSRVSTDLAVTSLAEAGVVVPWPITLKTEQGDRTLEGLYRIDETALNALPVEDFAKLRANGAMGIAYGQMFSMGQLSLFTRLANVNAQRSPAPVAALPNDLDKHFGLGIDTGDYLRFD